MTVQLLGLLAEVTHRCPLGCPYCSNPTELTKASAELDTKTWIRVITEAAELGALHIHLSGGEPLSRPDIVELVSAAHLSGLYTNLITSAIGLNTGRLSELRAAGLDHIQISIQGIEPTRADAVAHYKNAARLKKEAAQRVIDEGIALTINAVMHRGNIDELEPIIEFAEKIGAGRLEIAHVQYHGWALANRAQLMPTEAQFNQAAEIVGRERARLEGTLVIDHVIPDYYADRPKACMGGWGRQIIVVSPDGRALPCHAAATLPNLAFDNVKSKTLKAIWESGEAFNLYRGTTWMPAPCKGCDRAEIDWGGCRCQAFALTGAASATDPVCSLSPQHTRVKEQATVDAGSTNQPFRFRRLGG